MVYFNIGRASRTGVHEFITPNPIVPDPSEVVSCDLEVATAEQTNPAKKCRIEIHRSLDGVNWVFLAATNFTGRADRTGTPSVNVLGAEVANHYLKGRFVIGGDGFDDEMNVGFKVHSHVE